MKIGIRQPVLMDALNKGSIASTSKDAQVDTSNLALLIQSIKITVDEKKFTVESSTDRMSAKYSIPATKDDGIVVKETGCILIPAQEFIRWVVAQGENSTINMTLSKLAIPEIISTLDDIDISDSTDQFMIKKIGSVNLVSKDDKGEGSKWKIDCYDPDQVKSITFSPKIPKCFELGGGELENALSNVLIAVLDRDYEHILDSISIQTYGKDLYFAATDTKRCALYKIPADGVSGIEDDASISMLIQAVLLDPISKIIDKENPLTFSYDEDNKKVFITQKNLKIRLASTDKEIVDKFPNIQMLLEKEYKSLTSIERGSFARILKSISLVNNESALFSFSNEKDTLTIKSISEDNKLDTIIDHCVAPNSKDTAIIWNPSHIMDSLKIIKDNDINLCIPDNRKSVKIIGKDGDKLMYFVMAVDNPKYAVENE